MSTPAQIKNPTDFANALLGALGEPDTKTNVQNIVGWEISEGGNWHNTASFNPLDTSQPEPGSHVMSGGNVSGVQAYTSWQQGLDATVQTLEAGDYGYPGILNALSNSESWTKFTQAVSASSWGGKGNKYLLSFPTPPGSAGPTNANEVAVGTAATQQSGATANSPSTAPGSQKLTGMAGILQSLDQMYSPGLVGPKWYDPISWVSFVGTDVEHVGIEIFVRATSAMLSIGLIAIGLHTMLSSSTSGGGGGAEPALTFINNQKRTNLSQGRLEAAKQKEQDVAARHAERLADKERDRAARERIANTPRISHQFRHSTIEHKTNKPKGKVQVKWLALPTKEGK